jgi:hypothetical protein
MSRSKGSRRGGSKVGRPAPNGTRRVAQFAADEHIGLNQVYAGVKRGEIPHFRLGRSIYIPDDWQTRMVTGGKPS